LSQGASNAVNSPSVSQEIDQIADPPLGQGSPTVRDLTLFWDSFGLENQNRHVRDEFSSNPASRTASPQSRRNSLRSQIFSRPNTPDSQQVSQDLIDISQELQNISAPTADNLDHNAASEAASNLANLSLQLNNMKSRLGKDNRRLSRVERLDRSLSHASLLVEQAQLARNSFGEDTSLFVRRTEMQQELEQVKSLVHNSALSVRNEILDQFQAFMASSESRVARSVIDKVCDDYNRVGISCIQSKTALSRAVSELNAAVNTIQSAISELQQGFAVHGEQHVGFSAELATLREELQSIRSHVSTEHSHDSNNGSIVPGPPPTSALRVSSAKSPLMLPPLLTTPTLMHSLGAKAHHTEVWVHNLMLGHWLSRGREGKCLIS